MVTPSAALTTSCPCCTHWRFFERGVYCKKFENSKLAFSYSRLLSLFVYRRKEPGITKLVFCIFSFLTGTVLRKNVTLFHFENLCLIFTWKLNIWIFVWSWVSETKFSNVCLIKKNFGYLASCSENLNAFSQVKQNPCFSMSWDFSIADNQVVGFCS